MGEWIGRMGSQPQQNKSKYPGSTSMRDYVRSPVMMRLFQGGVLGVAMDNDVGFHAELMEWMPPPDGIAMCQSDVCNNVTQRREHP
ncbi:hypothetical protein D3C71_848800 [compost metagenome]